MMWRLERLSCASAASWPGSVGLACGGSKNRSARAASPVKNTNIGMTYLRQRGRLDLSCWHGRSSFRCGLADFGRSFALCAIVQGQLCKGMHQE